MAQFTALTPGTAAEVSADIAVPAQEVWHIGIYTDHVNGFQEINRYQSVQVVIDTPGADTIVATLHRGNPVVSIKGKSTVRVSRPSQSADGSVALGAFYNTEA